MAEPNEVIAACIEWGTQATNEGAFSHHVFETLGKPELARTHRKALRKAGEAGGLADEALRVLFSAAKLWGFDPNPLTDYQAHPNEDTRASAMTLVLRIRRRAEAEREAQEEESKRSSQQPETQTSASMGRAILSSIRTLPLPDDVKEILSRAVSLVKQRPDEFTSVGEGLDRHYSDAALRPLCEQRYQQNFADRLRGLRRDGTGNFALSTYKRRRALQQGVPREQLVRETIEEARLRGYRLNGNQLVCRTYPDQYPDEKMIDESNVELAWRSEDEQYGRLFREIKTERRGAKMGQYDHPGKPAWRLARAVEEIIKAEYPDPPEHLEHSRRIVGIGALLVCTDPLPVLGEFGRWGWASTPDTTWEANPHHPHDEFWRTLSQPPAQKGPHTAPLHAMHAREEGREEVLFQRMPGEPRELQSRWGDLSTFCRLLRVAADELEAESGATKLSRAEAGDSGGSLKPRRKMTGKYVKDKPITSAQKAAVEMLKECSGNKTEAAKRLGISRQALTDRLAGVMLRGELSRSRAVSARGHLPHDRRGQPSV